MALSQDVSGKLVLGSLVLLRAVHYTTTTQHNNSFKGVSKWLTSSKKGSRNFYTLLHNLEAAVILLHFTSNCKKT